MIINYWRQNRLPVPSATASLSLSLARSLAFSCSSSNHRLLVLFNSLFASPLLPLLAFRCGLRCRHLTSIRTPRRYYCFEGLGNQKGFDGQTHARSVNLCVSNIRQWACQPLLSCLLLIMFLLMLIDPMRWIPCYMRLFACVGFFAG